MGDRRPLLGGGRAAEELDDRLGEPLAHEAGDPVSTGGAGSRGIGKTEPPCG